MAEATGSESSKKVPTYKEMVVTAITELKERKGSSRTAIVNYISAHYCPEKNRKDIRMYVTQVLKKAMDSKEIINNTGAGMIGCFKLSPEFLSKQKSAKKASDKKEKEDKKSKDGVKAKKAKDVVKGNSESKKSEKSKNQVKVKVAVSSKGDGKPKSKQGKKAT